MARLLALAILIIPLMASAADRSSREEARIEYLLSAIASLHDARFVRNGASYDSSTAVKHLRLKLQAAGSRIQTAEDFIRYCATASSVSGRPYAILFSDGRRVASADFFRQKLTEFDQAH